LSDGLCKSWFSCNPVSGAINIGTLDKTFEGTHTLKIKVVETSPTLTRVISENILQFEVIIKYVATSITPAF
jgi:hypothetical protein